MKTKYPRIHPLRALDAVINFAACRATLAGYYSHTCIHTYRTRASDCLNCPIRHQCTRSNRRSLSVPFDDAVRQKVIATQGNEAFRQSRRLRKKVEMLFAHMKQHFRFTRLKLRGLAGAAEEFLMMATVQNLRRLVKLRPPDIPQRRQVSTT